MKSNFRKYVVKSAVFVFILSTVLAPAAAFATIGGAEPNLDDSITKSTVLLIRKSGICTGVVVGQHIVLTAAHCVSKGPGNPKEMLASEKLAVYAGNFINRQLDGSRLRIVTKSDVFVHKRYSGLLNNGSLRGRFNDIALIYVREGLPTDLIPAQLKWEISDLKRDQQVFVAGYGPSADEIASGSLILRKLEAAVMIPFSKESGQVGLMSIHSGTGMIRGDSGGPAFTMKADVPQIFGVASWVVVQNPPAAMWSFAYEPISNHRSWLRRIVRSLGVEREVF